jgi:hypothetical protein
VTKEGSFWAQFSSAKGDRFHLDPDKVRKMELCHEPPGRERVRVTVEYVTSEIRTLTIHKSVLATVLAELYAAESATQRRGAKSEPDT